ncbi:MAG TPA: hypothetical protein VF759_11450 [Allosphingosinicella sp.]|jgi:hypothetical protein
MFERLMIHGAALAAAAARRRRAELAEALAQEAPAGVEASESEGGVVLSGRGLGRRFALEPALRWLLAGRAR